jgi:hypothetical protein
MLDILLAGVSMLRPKVRVLRALLAVVAMAAIAAGAAGCSATATNSSTTTTTAPSVLITETYDGTVAVNGAATFSFGVLGTGAVTATYTSMAPDTGATMGLALGIWNGASCQVIIANDNAIVNSTVVGQASAAGNLCVRAYDIGKLTGTQTIELSITHF